MKVTYDVVPYAAIVTSSKMSCFAIAERQMPLRLRHIFGWNLHRSNTGTSSFVLITSVMFIVVTVGAVDYITPPEITFSAFYLLAIGIAAWTQGRIFAYFVSLLCIIVSSAGDLLSGTRYTSLFILLWDKSIVLSLYFIVIALLTRLRALTSDLESQIQERTATLTDEIATRERLERELIEISEREQRRIGHDLHDSLGQHLTGAALAGQVLGEKLAARRLPEAIDAGRLVDLIEEGIALSRKLARGLDPVDIQAEGLMYALEDLAATVSVLFRITCRFECESPILIHNASVSGHLYRITQEAISNAIRHGNCTRISVELEPLEDGIALRVMDDGEGLPAITSVASGMGLRIMAHRAKMIGAAFHATRADSGGTVVSCLLPYSEGTTRC